MQAKKKKKSIKRFTQHKGPFVSCFRTFSFESSPCFDINSKVISHLFIRRGLERETPLNDTVLKNSFTFRVFLCKQEERFPF